MGRRDEQLWLFNTDVAVLRPVEIEGVRRGGFWKPRYWVCVCGGTFHHTQVIKHLRCYHFYTEMDARYVFRQAKHGLTQNLPTLANLLTQEG